jgi:translation initiation factor IF-3
MALTLEYFSLIDALALVRSRREDLVEIDLEAVPPVCRAIDYRKYRYRLQQARKTRSHE